MKNQELTPRQEMFCQLYVELGNATAAYLEAYDSQNPTLPTINVRASQLRKRDKIAIRIAELLKERAEATNEGRKTAEATLLSIAEADPLDFYKWDEKKKEWEFRHLSEIPRKLRMAIKRIKRGRDGKITYELFGKVDAVALLARMNGWEAAKEVKVSGSGLSIQNEIRIGFDEEE